MPVPHAGRAPQGANPRLRTETWDLRRSDSMKVFIAGASGVLGRRLIRQLTARGHCAVGRVRSAKAESAVRAMGGEPRHADLFDAESLAKTADGCDTVIHAATAIPDRKSVVEG